jgi:hypothetical protein
MRFCGETLLQENVALRRKKSRILLRLKLVIVAGGVMKVSLPSCASGIDGNQEFDA